MDSDLAELYQVPTKALNQAVNRNADRFPDDFMFQLSAEEASALRSQFVTLKKGRGRYSKYTGRTRSPSTALPYFPLCCAASAAQMNILIIRAFVQIRELLATHKELAARVEKLEARQKQHESIIAILAEEIDQLKLLPEPRKRQIGFRRPEEGK